MNWKYACLTILIIAGLALVTFRQKMSGDTLPPENSHYTLTPVTLKWAGVDVTTTLRFDTQSGKASALWYEGASKEALGRWRWAEVSEK